MPEFSVRQARLSDYEAVVGFTGDTWPNQETGDYIPRVFEQWVKSDGPDQRTFVLEADGEVAGLLQGVMLSAYEAWAQGMRVAPAARGHGASRRMNDRLFDWAAEQGAMVCRNMVFSWNMAGLGTSRAVGYDPGTEFRWALPTPDADATAETDYRLVDSPDAAWTYWTRSDAHTALSGLALDIDEPWALATLTRERLGTDAERVIAVQDDGTEAFTFRLRSYDRENEDGEELTWAEYGVAAWADVPAARALFAAIRRDSASVGADRTRVLLPETPRHVTDAVHVGSEVSEDPDFVLEADLSARR
ncbi:GNAT family N-acetyltransferase [Natranaeroarchaeum sulfidigenes]|uniref:Acetyltransferase (GNAT) family n=1 Tax=Natranaeroarchaeum sulfidigenes TaxID=2784880 RepID=A0A897MWK7_9EURY|nr:GNAT family N-acetyltransferase [Natranaeroarchaeum sulfidigenes]QSG03299.1 Acetyltransferase (GNAT) family [Natranaeroarchaeum sulfidigenes]